ncbi:MAG: amino acid adenylation domain-containing protein [Tatlockia sp.]|nr:amino acid adenylation domain-containing protein [Tatlockia sp.]
MTNEHFELSPSQIPEWYAYQVDSQSAVYNISFNHYFFDDIDPALFIQTWQRILDRHAIFRICFGYEEGKPFQKLIPPIMLNAKDLIIDKTALDNDEILGWQNNLAKEFGEKPFDFEKGPLFRLHLVLYPENQSQLIFTLHHIIWDETSTINLIKEFAHIYGALSAGGKPSLPELTKDYFTYVNEMHLGMRSGKLDKHKAYWLTHYETVPPPLALPLDFSRPSIQTYQGDTVEQWLPRDLIYEVSPFLIQHNATLYIFYMTVLAAYFYRISGQNDFVLGSPIAGRDDPQYKDLLGCFAIPLPIRCHVEADDSFLDLLLRMRNEILAAFEHRQYPCSSLIENLHHQKDHSRPKLFSVMAGVQNDKSAFLQINLGKTKLYNKDVHRVEAHGARFDLAIGLDPLGSDIRFFCTYNINLFKPKTILTMMDGIIHLIRQVIKDSHKKLGSYLLGTEESYLQCIKAINQTTKKFPDEMCIQALFEKQALNKPNAVAIIYENKTLSYRDLNTRANQLARYLQKAGVSQNQGVGLILEPTPDMVAIMLAILKLGAYYVPLSPSWPEARIKKAMHSLGLEILLTDKDLNQLADLSAYSDLNLDLLISKDNLAYVVQTSGTTGQPKNIPISHKGVLNLLYATQANYLMSAEDKILFLTSYTFDASILELFWPLSFGAAIVMMDRDQHKDPLSIASLLSTHEITVVQMVPSLLKALAEVVSLDNQSKEKYRLRLIISGGAPLSRAISDLCQKTFPGKLVNHYGPSEVTVDATCFDCELDFEGEIVPIGKPIANVNILIVDNNRQPTPIGFPGEILVASPGLMSGYLSKKDDNSTDSQNGQSPFVELSLPGTHEINRFYRTGDLGWLDEKGVIYYQGRKDKQVKVNGYRIELEEIEQVLMAFPGINQAVVKLIKTPHLKSGECLTAFVEARQLMSPLSGKAGLYYQSTLGHSPDLIHQMKAVHLDTWPTYFAGSPFINKYWSRLWSEFPDYQFCLLDESGEMAAVCNGIPLYWDGSSEQFPTGWDAGIELAFEQAAKKINPNTILGLTGVVTEKFRSKGISSLIVKAFRRLCGLHGLSYFLGPVRPIGMFEAGHLDFDSWVDMKDEQGEPKDHWLRTHQRLGAIIVGSAPKSQLVEGSLADWATWTGQVWQQSGLYQLSETLQPVEVNIEENWARYYDPSIWVMHKDLDLEVKGAKPYFNISDLKAHLGLHLPSYMIPYHFCLVEKLPANDSGKINESLLLDKVRGMESSQLKPETDSQKIVYEIWREVLDIDEFGIEDDFFMLGGQSLQMLHVLEKIYRQFLVRIPMKLFYQFPNIKKLCSEVLAC